MTHLNPITGKEPCIISSGTEKGKQRLSLRRLGTMLNMLPPGAVALDAVAQMLRSEDVIVRYNAARLLKRRADREARLIMERGLQDTSPRTRASVARHVGGFSWYTIESLARVAFSDSDARVREAIVYALCELREVNAFHLLQQYLAGEADSVLAAAAFALKDTQDSAALPVLAQVLRATDPDIRIKALEALGICGLRDAIPLVRASLTDPEPEVKYAATLSLLELAGESWLAELSGMIGRTSGDTLEQILRAFFHATNYLKLRVVQSDAAEMVIDALETALLDEHAGVRKAAVWSLAWLRHDRAPAILLKTFRIERDAGIRQHMLRVAAGLMNDATDALLNEALNDRDEAVRTLADDILGRRSQYADLLIWDPGANPGADFDRSLLLGRFD
jgi:HEAT repeat protein